MRNLGALGACLFAISIAGCAGLLGVDDWDDGFGIGGAGTSSTTTQGAGATGPASTGAGGAGVGGAGGIGGSAGPGGSGGRTAAASTSSSSAGSSSEAASSSSGAGCTVPDCEAMFGIVDCHHWECLVTQQCDSVEELDGTACSAGHCKNGKCGECASDGDCTLVLCSTGFGGNGFVPAFCAPNQTCQCP